MKKYILFILLALCSLNSFAQSSMTDTQVMDFVQKEHKKGTPQAQIVTKLMQSGVDISQIRRVRNIYEKMQKGNAALEPQKRVRQRIVVVQITDRQLRERARDRLPKRHLTTITPMNKRWTDTLKDVSRLIGRGQTHTMRMMESIWRCRLKWMSGCHKIL